MGKKGHSLLAPSSSQRWSSCTSSPTYEALYENKNTPQSVRGTLIHDIGEMMLKGMPLPEHEDETMYAEAKNYSNYIHELECWGSVIWKTIEKRVSIPIHKEAFGTMDYACLIDHGDKKVLHVIDLKTGRVPVQAKDSKQMRLYALGIMELLNDDYIDYDAVELHIVQDNESISNTNSHVVSLKQLAKFQAKMRLKASEVYGMHCTYCKHLGACDKATDTMSALTIVEDQSLDMQLAIMQNKAMILKYIETLEEKFTTELLSGVKHKGLKLVKARVRRSWADDAEVLKAFRHLTLDDADLYEESKLLSPSKMTEKFKINNKGNEDLKNTLNSLLEQKEPQLVVAIRDDRRKAVNLAIDTEIDITNEIKD